MTNQEEYLKNEWFQRWVASENDLEAEQYWEEWMKLNPDQATDLIESRNMVRAMSFENHTVSAEQVDASWNEVRTSIYDGYLSTFFGNGFRVAATLAFLVASLMVFQYLSSEEDLFSLQEESSSYIVKYAEKGTKLTVQLSDGSKIKLNGGSKLVYPEVFCSSSREVELTGEGYFIVAHDKDRPFIVKTGGINTTVLGTKFAVNARNLNKVQVALVSGKVKVENIETGKNDSKCTAFIPGTRNEGCLFRELFIQNKS